MLRTSAAASLPARRAEVTAPTLLATGFVADSPGEGTLFPSAGGNSADPKVQAIYWRCLVVFFASARITNPAQSLALFTNVDPPHVDGIAIAEVLHRYGVQVRRVPLTARLAPGRTAAWGNVLYFFDIMAEVAAGAGDLRFALTDADVVVTGALAPLFDLLGDAEFAGYPVPGTGADDDVNGLSPRAMGSIAAALGVHPDAPVVHYGGELFVTSAAAWRGQAALFHAMLDQAAAGEGPAAGVLTEEHVFSIAFALLGLRVARADRQIKRIWTSPRFSTAAPGDERLPIWHVPAERRYGLADLFGDLARAGFPTDMDPYDFRLLAMRRCGLPAKSAAKLARDGVRQVAAKLGLRR